MYIVKIYDGYDDPYGTTIHSIGTDNNKLLNGSITQGINTIDKFEFDYHVQSPAHGQMKPFKTLVKVYNTQSLKYDFEGRILQLGDSLSEDSISFSAVALSELDYLHDSMSLFMEYEGTLPNLLKTLLDRHNSLVEDYKRFEIGNITVTDANNYVHVWLNQKEDTYEAIMRTLVEVYGGELVIRKVGETRYLDYLTTSGKDSTTTIQLAKNLVTFTRDIDPTEIITRLIPLGASVEPEETVTGDEYPFLTVSSVNGGKEYIDSPTLINAFGVQVGNVEYNDITNPTDLYNRGNSFLKNQKLVLYQYQVTALDLALVGKDIDQFQVGNRHQLINPIMNVNEPVRVITKSIDVVNPQDSSMTLGDKFKTQTEMQVDIERNARDVYRLQTTLNRLSNTTNYVLGTLSSADIANLPNTLQSIQEQLNSLQNPPTASRYFPVDYSLPGINFFKRSNWAEGTLQYEMTYGNRTGGLHSGYDIGSGGNAGYPVYATTSGKITWSGWKDGGIGNCIYIEHSTDSYWSNYMHLASMTVSAGDTVVAGQQIGVMGNSGGDYAIHLHYELSPDGVFHSGGNTVNPESYLGITGDNKTSLPRPV